MILFLWTGPRHSGKTTAAAKLVCAAGRDGLRVAGLLAPSVYRGGLLVGFDALDLQSGAQAPLAVRRDGPGDPGTPRFNFLEEGLRVGNCALDVTITEGADLIVVDEFGPLELASRGWRSAVDSLVRAGKAPLCIVVRRELAEALRNVYANVPSRIVDAADPESISKVIHWLGEERAVEGT